MAEQSRGSYFSLVSGLLLFLSLAAFSDNLLTDIRQPSNSDPKMVVHGLFGLAWNVLLVVQANLVRVRNLALHRKLGIATMLVGLGVTLSTLYLFIVLWKGWDNMAPEVRANRLLLPGFALFLLLAWLRRGRADWHKRLVLAGSFLMLGPVLSRLYDPLVVPLMESLAPAFTARVDEVGFLVFLVVAWVGFFLSLAAYDWKTQRRVHPVTITGFAWLMLAWLVSAFS